MATQLQKKLKEPAVISVALLQQALELQAAAEEKKSDAARPATQLAEAQELRLSFRGLLRIENLQSLRSLRKLQLDNNNITRIENFEPLVNLEWLDLSFNLITAISGLEHLTKLADLTLYHNRITAVEGLDGCSSLQVLSLGNNLLTDLEGTILYFRRKMPQLEVLTLEGNPLCKPGEGGRDIYRASAYAFLPRLKYLDYQLVSAAERTAAREGGVPAEKLQEVEEVDALEEKARQKAAERAAMLADLTAANLEAAETIVEDMIDDDSEWMKVKGMPGVPQLIQAMREAIAPKAAELKEFGGEKDKQIREEMSMFNEAQQKTAEDAQAAVASRFSEWQKACKRASRAHSEAPSEETSAALEQLMDGASDVATACMQTELEAHENVEAMLDMYETALGELRVAKLAYQEQFFRAAEAAEAQLTEGLHKLGEQLLADSSAGRLPPDFDEELASLATDREALLGALAGAHEARVARILRKEADLRGREEKRCTGAVGSARASEVSRNRERIFEIRQMAESCVRRARDAMAGLEGQELHQGAGGPLIAHGDI